LYQRGREQRSGLEQAIRRGKCPAEDILTAKIGAIKMRAMRTTVTLDPDVEQLLRDAMQQRRRGFKEVLNQAIRAGLAAPGSLGVADRPFTLRAQPMGLRPGIDAGRLNQLADELESDAFADLSHRLLRGGKPRARRRK